jgi:hypothetical protein
MCHKRSQRNDVCAGCNDHADGEDQDADGSPLHVSGGQRPNLGVSLLRGLPLGVPIPHLSVESLFHGLRDVTRNAQVRVENISSDETQPNELE